MIVQIASYTSFIRCFVPHDAEFEFVISPNFARGHLVQNSNFAGGHLVQNSGLNKNK